MNNKDKVEDGFDQNQIEKNLSPLEKIIDLCLFYQLENNHAFIYINDFTQKYGMSETDIIQSLQDLRDLDMAIYSFLDYKVMFIEIINKDFYKKFQKCLQEELEKIDIKTFRKHKKWKKRK